MAKFAGAVKSQTPNKAVAQDGEVGYLSCGADIILSGLFQDLVGETACPVCHQTVKVDIKGKKIALLSPPTALLHYVRIPFPNSTMFGVRCESTFIFDRRSCLDRWLESYVGPPGRISPLEDFLSDVISTRQQQ